MKVATCSRQSNNKDGEVLDYFNPTERQTPQSAAAVFVLHLLSASNLSQLSLSS